MSQLFTTGKEKDLIFDVGLHRGEDTEYYLKKGFRVVAFEANPELVAHCRDRFRTQLDTGQLHIVQGAIVEPAEYRAGRRKIEFYRNAVGSGWGTIRNEWAERNLESGNASSVVEVDTLDFAEAIRNHGIPHYMKIDIEGCDMICVESLAGFRERPDYVSIESDKTSFRGLRREIDRLSALGYRSFQAVEQSAVVTQSPPAPAREGATIEHRFEDGASGLFGAELDRPWQSRAAILRLYRVIRLGYYLLGDDGILNRTRIRGASRLRKLARRMLGAVTHDAVPGWYDTHARLLPAGR